MLRTTLALLAAGFVAIGSARADIVLSSSLQDVNGPYGSVVATTTTDSSGKRTTVTGLPNSTSRASGTAAVGSWFQENVGVGSVVGITSDYQRSGNGSAYFSTTGNNSKGDLQYYFGSSTPLSSLTSLSYEFYRDGTSTTGANFSPVVRFDIAKNGAFAGSLVLEDFYQAQTAPPIDTWTTLSATLTSGIFWATNAALGPTFAAANGGQKTLQAWIDANAGSTLSVYGMTIGAGSGWNGLFAGAVDNVNVAFANGPTLASNFEVAAATAVPEPASILLTLGGIGALSLFRRRQAR